MAIVNSLAIGKSKKSAGNLTYATVKGRTIAKQKVVEVHNPNTPAQQAQRTAMATIVLFWQVWASAFKSYFTKLKPLFSAFNQFVHMNKEIMHTPGLITPDDKIGAIAGMYVSSGYYGEGSIALSGGPRSIDFLNVALANDVKAGDKFIRINPSTNKLTMQVESHTVTAEEVTTIKEQMMLIEAFPNSEESIFAVLFQSADGKVTSTSKFVDLSAS